MFAYSELSSAYDYANFYNDPEAAAYVNVKEGKIVVLVPEERSESGEYEEARKALQKGEWIALPEKRELGLGKDLVFRFAEDHFSLNEQRFIAGMFSRSGAYGNWRDFLECKGLLNEWHQFENEEEDKALKEWLTDMEIPFRDDSVKK